MRATSDCPTGYNQNSHIWFIPGKQIRPGSKQNQNRQNIRFHTILPYNYNQIGNHKPNKIFVVPELRISAIVANCDQPHTVVVLKPSSDFSAAEQLILVFVPDCTYGAIFGSPIGRGYLMPRRTPPLAHKAKQRERKNKMKTKHTKTFWWCLAHLPLSSHNVNVVDD